MITVHVDDMLLTTNISHRAESHISRLLSKHDINDVKRADDDGGEFGVCCVSLRRPDGVCESSLRTRQFALGSSPTRRRVSRHQSVQGKQSAPLVTDHKRAVPTLSTLEEPAGNWFEV